MLVSDITLVVSIVKGTQVYANLKWCWQLGQTTIYILLWLSPTYFFGFAVPIIFINLHYLSHKLQQNKSSHYNLLFEAIALTMENKHKPTTLEEKAAMQQPYPFKRCPKTMKLEPGKQYLYCMCGLSQTQPFCDGSHVGTKFQPLPFIAKPIKNSLICLCRRASGTSLPYCDGMHSQIDF